MMMLLQKWSSSAARGFSQIWLQDKQRRRKIQEYYYILANHQNPVAKYGDFKINLENTQILQKSWQFQKKIPQNVAIFLKIFQKVPFTMLLGIFYFFKMATNFRHKQNHWVPLGSQEYRRILCFFFYFSIQCIAKFGKMIF